MRYNDIVLNPDYYFKNDIDRIVMYSGRKVQDYSSPDWIGFIHPVQAMILDTFSIRHIDDGAYIETFNKLKMPEASIEKIIAPFIENKTPVYTEYKGQRVMFPKNVLIHRDMVGDVENKRMQSCDFECDNIDLTPDRMHRAPQSILFMLTSKCYTNCKYCYADRKTKYIPLSTSKILDIIEQASALGMTYIDVIGGEVFCRKDWPVILKKMVDMHLMPSYISTKVPISEEEIRILRETGYTNVIQISLDSTDDKILHDIIGVKDGYVERIKNTISLLCKYGFKVQIDTILTKLTATHSSIQNLFEYVSTIPELVYWEIRVPEISIYSTRQFEHVQASKEQINDIVRFVRGFIIPKAKFSIYISDEAANVDYCSEKDDVDCFHGGACGILETRMFILPDGKVGPCEQLYWFPQYVIGDLNKQSIQEVWTSDKALSLFKMSKDMFRAESKCHNCKSFNFCNDHHRRCIVKVIKAYGKENWDYPDPRCVYAPKVRTNLIYDK